jgi:RNA-directed DNA polymerase
MIIKELSEHLGVSIGSLVSHMHQAPLTYKRYGIPKRAGGMRFIAQPTAFVKTVQKGIVGLLLNNYKPLASTMGYTKGRSIVDNAKAHAGSKYILKMDFENFFPSITSLDFLAFLDKSDTKLQSVERVFLSRYLFIKEPSGLVLSIGAPSSPAISNMVMYDIDNLIQQYCDKHSIKFTRYADDLTFSCYDRQTIKCVIEEVKRILTEVDYPKLSVNNKKTTIIGKGKSQRVTGIILTHSGGVSSGRHLRKKIRAMLHQYSNKKLKREDIPYLHGVVSHLRNVEPEHFEKLMVMHGEVLFSRLAKQSFHIGKEKKKEEMNYG